MEQVVVVPLPGFDLHHSPLYTYVDKLSTPVYSDDMPEIETLLLCEHAEVFNGLLYLAGAGFTDIQRPLPPPGFLGNPEPPPTHLGIALTVLVPWHEANRRFPVHLWIEPEDGGNTPQVDIRVQFEQGRPPGIPEGSDQRAALALGADVRWPSRGGYRLSCEIEGVQNTKRSVSFRVHDLPVIGIAQAS